MRLSAWRLAATVWPLFLPAALFAQAPAGTSEKCRFAGVVQDAVSGQPMAHAQVGLRNAIPGKGSYIAVTDAAGAFHYEAIEPGDYVFTASASEHVLTGSVHLPAGQAVSTIHCTPGQSTFGAVARLTPDAVISGRVMDADGQPIPGADIGLIQEIWRYGDRRVAVASTSTDLRGQYRRTVAPGRYYLSAGMRIQNGGMPVVFSEGPGKPEMRIATLIYPNAANLADAAPIDLRPGQQFTADFHLPTVPVYHVRGAVRGTMQGPRMMELAREGFWGEFPNLDKDGAFDQPGVEPGSYELEAMAFDAVGLHVPVQVTDRDVNGVIFTALAPADLHGRVRLEDDQPYDLSKLRVRVERLDTDFPLGRLTAEVRADGTFLIEKAPASPVEIELQLPPGDLYLKSLTFNQREVEGRRLDLTGGGGGEIEMVLASGTGTIAGTVHLSDTEPGQAAAAADGPLLAVLASPDGVTGNTGARSTAIDAKGGFQFQSVPPGRYYVWAATNFDPDHWQNMDFVTQMESHGVAVELEKKGTAQVEIPRVVE